MIRRHLFEILLVSLIVCAVIIACFYL
ncbi:small membrane protein YdgU [Enterobacillus tribolii]